MGKGSAPRPFEVDHKTYESNWDAIFGKKNDVLRSNQDSGQGEGRTADQRDSDNQGAGDDR